MKASLCETGSAHFVRAREAKKVTVMLEVCLLVWEGWCHCV